MPAAPTITSQLVKFPHADAAQDFLNCVIELDGSNLDGWSLMVQNRQTGNWDPLPLAKQNPTTINTEEIPPAQFIDGQNAFGGWYQFILWDAGETGATFSLWVAHPQAPVVTYATYTPDPWVDGEKTDVHIFGLNFTDGTGYIDAVAQYTESVSDTEVNLPITDALPGIHYARVVTKFGASAHTPFEVVAAPPAPPTPVITGIEPSVAYLDQLPIEFQVTGEFLTGGTIHGWGPVGSTDPNFRTLETSQVSDSELTGTATIQTVQRPGVAMFTVRVPADQTLGARPAVVGDEILESNEFAVTILAGGAPPPVSGRYPTCAELVAESTVAALTDLSTTQQEELYEQTLNSIHEFCGQTFDFKPGATYTINGSGSDVLYLPKRLEAITGLVVEGSGLSLGDVLLDDPFDRLVVRPNASGGWNYYEQVMAEFGGNLPFKFTFDDENVTITGDWGWSTFPGPVRTAIRKDMEDTALADGNLLNQTIRAYRKFGMRDISQGNLRASFGFAPGLGDEVINLLTPYVWQGNIGHVL
jgi:hypothetical protein